MTVAVIKASPSGFGQITSAYGSYTWMTSPTVPTCYLPDSAGTLWAIWKFIGNIPPGQLLNAVNIGGVNTYLVGNGVAVTRFADVFVRMQKVFTDFMSQPGTYAQTVIGRGTQVPMVYNHKPDSFFSDDFNAGNCYRGIAVRTNTADTEMGAGTFQLGSLTFTFYFGSDTDVPPPDTTPSVTVRLAFGTPRFVEARSSNALLAAAAAARHGGVRLVMPPLPLPPPVAFSQVSGCA